MIDQGGLTHPFVNKEQPIPYEYSMLYNWVMYWYYEMYWYILGPSRYLFGTMGIMCVSVVCSSSESIKSWQLFHSLLLAPLPQPLSNSANRVLVTIYV